jgi:transposase
VRAYEEGLGSYPEVAAQFAVGEASVKRWVRLHRSTGSVVPAAKGGGTPSAIALVDLEQALAKVRDATAGELTAEYNRGRGHGARVHVSSSKRALRRHGYVVKKAPTATGESAAGRRRNARAIPSSDSPHRGRAVGVSR